jgi:hypothetical protein
MRLDKTRGGASRDFSPEIVRFLGNTNHLERQFGREPDKVSATARDMLEVFRAVVEELQMVNEALLLSQERAAHARQRYQELFDFAPDGYLITDLQVKREIVVPVQFDEHLPLHWTRPIDSIDFELAMKHPFLGSATGPAYSQFPVRGSERGAAMVEELVDA